MDIAERFAQNLMRQRKLAGITQEELAWRADVHRTQISLLESGKRQPTLTTLVKLAGALSVPSERLVEGIRWEPPRSQGGGFEISGGEDG